MACAAWCTGCSGLDARAARRLIRGAHQRGLGSLERRENHEGDRVAQAARARAARARGGRCAGDRSGRLDRAARPAPPGAGGRAPSRPKWRNGRRRALRSISPWSFAPTLWCGLAEHHMAFGATITLDFATFHSVIRCVCASILRHGFRRLTLLNGHGGNIKALDVIAGELKHELGARVVSATYWTVSSVAGRVPRDSRRAGRRRPCLRGGDLDDAGARAGPRRARRDAPRWTAAGAT